MNAISAQFAVQIFALVFLVAAIAMGLYLFIANKKDNKQPEALPGAERFAKTGAVAESAEQVEPAAPKFSFEDAATPAATPVDGLPLPPPPKTPGFPSRRTLRNSGQAAGNARAGIFASDDDVDDWE